MDKEELEFFVLEKFKEHYENFPKGEIIKGERPDFKIVNNAKTTGIEIAEVFQDLDSNKASYLKELEIKHGMAGATLEKYIRKYTDRNFIFDIEFSIHHDFGVNQINDLMKECLSPCLEFIMNNSKGHVRLLTSIYHPFPKEINSIYIQMLKEDTVYSNGQGGTVSNLQYEHIEGILSKHEKSLSSYEECDEYWLLIREGNYYAGSFQEIDIQTPIESKFEKVFILRTNKAEIITLK